MRSSTKLALGIFALFFLFLSLGFVSAAVDTVIVNHNDDGVNYNYSVIGRTYTLYVSYNDSGEDVSSSSNGLSLVSSSSDSTGSVYQYTFVPGNLSGVRTFGSGANQFNLSVLSEADELIDSIGGAVINITDNSSSVEINNLNLTGRIVNALNITRYKIYDLKGYIYFNKILDGMTFDLNFVKGANYPDSSSSYYLDPDGHAWKIMFGLLQDAGIDCGEGALGCSPSDFNSDKSVLNDLIDYYEANFSYPYNARAVKSGNNFEFTSDEGYATLNNDDLTNARDIISKKIKNINPDEIINQLLPLVNLSEYEKFIDFNVSVDFGDMSVLESGTYNLQLNYVDKYGNNGSMPFVVNLNVTNIGENVTSDTNGTVNFTGVIGDTLQTIKGLPSNVTLTPYSWGNSQPSGFVSPPTNVHALNFIQINSSNNSATDNGNYTLYFKIATNSLSSSLKNNVSLYVQESGSWTKLDTQLYNETSSFYYYNATLHHFSNYLIAYYQAPTSSGSSGSGGSSSSSESNAIGSSKNRNSFSLSSPPTNTASNVGGEPTGIGDTSGNSGSSGITGAVIGAISSPGGIVTIVFVLILIVLWIILRTRRSNVAGKEEKSPLEPVGYQTVEKSEEVVELKESKKTRKKSKKSGKKNSKKKKLNSSGDKIGKK